MSEWGGSDNGSNKDDALSIKGSQDGDGEKTEREPVTYEPEYDANTDEKIYEATCSRGIDFDKYFDIPVKVTGENVPSKITTFDEASLNPKLLENIKKCQWTKPTPIQMSSLPIISAKRDLMACAQTGSGKTGGYSIPIINSLLNDGIEAEEQVEKEAMKPQALVVAPTRELVQQIQRDFAKLCRDTKIISNYAVGGHAVRYQLSKIQEGTNILVATPGRLNDFVGKNKIDLSELKFLVLDEADRMLDMGFKPILDDMAHKMATKEERTTLMFSATFKPEVQSLGKDLLKEDYLFASVGVVGGAADSVTQTILQVDKKEIFKNVISIIEPSKETKEKFLIFVETKRQTDFYASKLCQMEYPATSIHGDRSQNLREEALRTFMSGETPILVATNVAARGLDIPNVSHVINVEMPKEIDEYVHRIGRSGRCGHKGKATSFYLEERDEELKAGLVQILSGAQQPVPDFLTGSCDNAVAEVGGGDDEEEDEW